jgi:hypothetical protein
MVDMAGCPVIGGIKGGIGGEMATTTVVGGDGAAGRMAGDWRCQGRDWRGDGVAGRGWRRAGGDMCLRVRLSEKEDTGVIFTGFAECQIAGTRQRFFFKIKKYTLPSAPDLGLDKDVFVEYPLTSTRQNLDLGFLKILCRVPHGWHSAKPSVSSVLAWALDKVYIFFIFFTKLLWYVPTLCRPTCTILGQL